MIVGTMRVSAFIGESHSLKDKRHVLKSVKDRVHDRFNVSIAEVESNDLWQKTELGVAVVSNDIGDESLRELKRAGVIGIAFNATLLGTEHYARTDDLLRRLAGLDMLVSLQVEHDQLVALRSLIERTDVRVLIDHCGRPAAGGGIDQPGFQTLLALGRMGREGRVAVKLSGYQKFSTLPPPYEDTRPFLDALLDAFTLDACLWASDWPFLRAAQRLDVGPLLRQVERLLPATSDRRKLLWDTPRRWLGF